ncbi:hypothetical protein BS78_05G101400 [Paspalum vaginatum]|nr:hypothetical protein BS78_05G101400 [Paspalum vaginatum]
MQRRAEFSFPGSPARGLPPRYGADEEAEEEVRWLQGSPDYGSGTPSPQLWAAHHHRAHPASAGASPSRAQAIAGYRREMLDLVRGLPESAYELSLRDIVERPAPASPPRPAPAAPPPQQPSGSGAAAAAPRGDAEPKDAVAVAAADDGQGAGSGGKRQGRKQRTMRKQRSRSLERSVSLDTGLLIKLFLPLSIAGRKKVSPKPDAAKDGKKKKNKEKTKTKQGSKKKKEAAVAAPAQEEEWWTKSESSEAGASSRTSSTGSSNSSSAATIRNVNGAGGANPRAPVRSWSRKRNGCYAFFRANKGKSGVNQD